MYKLRHAVVTLVVLTLTGAAAVALELGSPAPPLQIKEWLKGQPVNVRDGLDKHVYVVKFWATWCGPCRQSIPHLSAIQKKYADRGVVVIAVTSGEEPEAVQKFMKERGNSMEYTVAFDDGKATHAAYMTAFGRQGIPQIFVVDKKGRIVWEGHPMLGLDEVVEQVVSGQYDVKSLQAVTSRIMERMARQEALLGEYLMLVSVSDDARRAAELGEKVLKELDGEANLLNMLSWTILTAEGVKTRDLQLALRAARSANEATGGEDFSILDTYARALWDNGQKAEAIELQKKAVARAPNDAIKAELQRILENYEKQM
jgi:thiol-disulfide isomerase/thioredoxin